VLRPELQGAQNDNIAAVVFWGLLFLLAPEPRFRTDALGAIYAVMRSCGLPSGSYKPKADWPKFRTTEQLCGADVSGLDLFWFYAPLHADEDEDDGASIPPSPPPSPPGPSAESPWPASSTRRCSTAGGEGNTSRRGTTSRRSSATPTTSARGSARSARGSARGAGEEPSKAALAKEEFALGKPALTQQELVGLRLGLNNGRRRNPTELISLVFKLSEMLSVRLRRLSTAFLTEAGSVMYTLMDPAAKQITIELLLPWVKNIALLEAGRVRRVPTHLKSAGFCFALPEECLKELFTYSLEVSGEGLPPLVAKFWRHLANAAPPKKDGQPPHNVPVLVNWIAGEARRRESEREKRVCNSLLWFVKELALAGGDEGGGGGGAKKRWQAAGGLARKTQIIASLRESSKKVRSKSLFAVEAAVLLAGEVVNVDKHGGGSSSQDGSNGKDSRTEVPGEVTPPAPQEGDKPRKRERPSAVPILDMSSITLPFK
tara:strand:+ start:3985 stop:5445 length:1461 start_codon:yes stop_codon:yes gene_type:complete